MCRQIAFQEGIPDGVSTQAWRDPSAGTVEYAWVFNFGKEWWGGKGEGLKSSRVCWTYHYFYNIHISKNNLFFLSSPYQTKIIAPAINDDDIIGWDWDTQHTAHGSASLLFLSVDGNSTGRVASGLFLILRPRLVGGIRATPPWLPSCSGLVSHGHLEIWSPFAGGLGGIRRSGLFEEVCPWGWVFCVTRLMLSHHQWACLPSAFRLRCERPTVPSTMHLLHHLGL